MYKQQQKAQQSNVLWREIGVPLADLPQQISDLNNEASSQQLCQFAMSAHGNLAVPLGTEILILRCL